MPYIAREDGVHFVIPSYRDVLLSKKSALQREMVDLSQSYGEYVTMQRKGPQQYEVAFSPDTGYLLGESVWAHFNRPLDMIYCEIIPNTTEAILVIVKAGSVYLDGSFPVESIPEELVIFLTQQNNFEIYVYGDVPITEKPTDGKFSFDAASVKSYTVLDQPVFKNLPLLPIYQLQILDVVLKENGIGVFPVKQLLFVGAVIVGVILLISMGLKLKPEPEEVVIEPNPYENYVIALNSPAPDQLMQAFVDKLNLLYSMPGWYFSDVKLGGLSVDALVRSSGNTLEGLAQWCAQNKATYTITPIGVLVSLPIDVPKRPKPKVIVPLKEVLTVFLDRLQKAYPGNNLRLSIKQTNAPYVVNIVSINAEDMTPMLLGLVGEQLKDLPITLDEVTMSPTKGLLAGKIVLSTMGK